MLHSPWSVLAAHEVSAVTFSAIVLGLALAACDGERSTVAPAPGRARVGSGAAGEAEEATVETSLSDTLGGAAGLAAPFVDEDDGDARAVDHTTESAGPMCPLIFDEVLEASVQAQDGSGTLPFALSIGEHSQVGVVYASSSCDEGLVLAVLDSDGSLVRTEKRPLAGCAPVASVALSNVSGQWMTAWVDAADRSVHTEPSERGALRQRTEGATELLAWSAGSVHALAVASPAAGVALLGADATETGRIVQNATDARALAITDVDGEGLVAAWVQDGSGDAGIYTHRVSDQGVATGEPQLINEIVGPRASVDLAPSGFGAAAVYTVDGPGGPGVRLQRLDRSGVRLGSAFGLVTRPDRGQDASLAARTANTFTIAYRAPSRDGEEWMVHLAFVDTAGSVVQNVPVAVAAGQGGRTSVESLSTGAVVIAWVDASPEQAVLRVVRMTPDCRQDAP